MSPEDSNPRNRGYECPTDSEMAHIISPSLLKQINELDIDKPVPAEFTLAGRSC